MTSIVGGCIHQFEMFSSLLFSKRCLYTKMFFLLLHYLKLVIAKVYELRKTVKTNVAGNLNKEVWYWNLANLRNAALGTFLTFIKNLAGNAPIFFSLSKDLAWGLVPSPRLPPPSNELPKMHELPRNKYLTTSILRFLFLVAKVAIFFNMQTSTKLKW